MADDAPDPSLLLFTATTSSVGVVTRFGRVVKKPQRYEPQEQVCDDFDDTEYDSFSSSNDSSSSSEEDSGDDSDSGGSLADFIEEEEEECD